MKEYLQKIEPLEAQLKKLMSVSDNIFSEMSIIDRQLPKEQFEKQYSDISDRWHKAQLELHESQEYKDLNTKINSLAETYLLLNRARTHSEEMIEYQTEVYKSQIFLKAKENFKLLNNFLH